MPALEPAEELAEIRSTGQRAALWRRRRLEPSQRDGARLAGAVAELSFEGPAETGRIGEAKVLSNNRDRCSCRGVRQDGLRFEQTLMLDVPSDAALVFKQPIDCLLYTSPSPRD